MGQEQVLAIVSVPGVLQQRRYFLLRELRFLTFRVGDVVVVDDTPTLRILAVVCRGQEVHLVAVAAIGAKQRATEVRRVLLLVVASSIVVVQVEAEAGPLACIDGEFSLHVVFAVQLVATVVVADVGVGRQGVGEEEVVRFYGGVVVGLREVELTRCRPVDEDTVLARRVVVARRVVFPVQSRVVDGVLVEMRHGVQLSRAYVSESAVYGPCPYALRNLLVDLGGVSLVGVEVAVVAVFVALDDVSVFIHLVIHLCLNAGTDEQNHQREQFLHHSIFIIRNTISMNLNTIDARMM